MEYLKFDVSEGIATLTLNRPKAYNALSLAMLTELHEQLKRLHQNSDVQAVILCAEGPGFCAGHDLKELKTNQSASFYKKVFSACSALMLEFHKLRQPVIAAVHGVATAAGCQLVASCDLAVAAANTKFATPGVNIGLFCSTPMVALTRNVTAKHAMAMLLTGDQISAKKAKKIGLINTVVEPGQQLEAAVQLARKLTEKSPLTLAIGKEAFYQQTRLPIEAAYAYCSEVMARNMLTLDAQEGIQAQLEKRPAEWQGC